jgi:hypothetical protein
MWCEKWGFLGFSGAGGVLAKLGGGGLGKRRG